MVSRAPHAAPVTPIVPRCTLPLGGAPDLLDAAYSTRAIRGHERYLLPETWALHLYLYHGRLHLPAGAVDFLPGWASLTPPAQPHVLDRPQPAPHYWVLFRAHGDGKGGTVTVPRLWDGGMVGEGLMRAMRDLIRSQRTRPARSRAILWHLLWNLPESGVAPGEVESPPLVREAEILMTRDLHRPHKVAWYARHLDCSLSTLEVAFRRHHGKSPLQWIAEKRGTWALDLLKGTHLGVKEVARAVGFHDLQQFNKWMRRAHGASPRKLRVVNPGG